MITPHSLKTLKHFAEFMANSIKGVLDGLGDSRCRTRFGLAQAHRISHIPIPSILFTRCILARYIRSGW